MASQNVEQHLSSHDERTLNSIFNPNMPFTDEELSMPKFIEDDSTEEAQIAKELEVQGVKCAEGGDMLSAIDFFNQAVTTAPRRASGYNNRAQALRLKGDIQGAKQDLDQAIELSRGNGKAACQAYTQRATIKRLEGDDDGALSDFKLAASLGSPFAKEMCIALNPYAAMCNAMLSEVVQKCQHGEM